MVLLMSMVNEKQPFVLRCAVLYCFQSFLYKNELGQSQIIQTLLPTTAEGTDNSCKKYTPLHRPPRLSLLLALSLSIIVFLGVFLLARSYVVSLFV